MQRSIATIAAAFLLALAVGVIAVALNGWFGSGDLVPFVIYCVPFALLAAPAEAIVFRLTTRLPVWLASAFAFIAGLLCLAGSGLTLSRFSSGLGSEL